MRAILAEGAVIERLRRDARVELDARLLHAAFPLRPETAAPLAAIYREYLDIGREFGLPMVCFTPTWRANAERAGAALAGLNAGGVRFLRGIAAEYTEVEIGGLLGCRGDAYGPEEALDRKEAARFHAAQVAALAAAGPDFLFAATLPEAGEALGIAEAMAASGLPYILSFIVGRDGALLDGVPLEEAIERVDREVRPAPLGYFINCVHPSVAERAMERTSPAARARLLGYQGNTSSKTPSELEGLAELDSEDPEAFASAVVRVGRRYGLQTLGGCCGTDGSHIRAIARRLQATSAGRGSGVKVNVPPASS